MTEEFHLSVTPVGTDVYLVRTEKVAPGVPLAEEQVVWPVSDWLNQARQLLDDPMLGLLQTSDHRFIGEKPSPSSPPFIPDGGGGEDIAGKIAASLGLDLNLVSLGQQLYNALFYGTIRDSWLGAGLLARDRGAQLRLRLGLKDRRLACLPWEIMYADDRPLATGTDVVFSRYQPTPVSQPSSRVHRQHQEPTRVLKILMAIAAPSDRAFLELEAEALQLKAELEKTTAAVSDIQLEILPQPDREQLTRALEHGQYQVFHYAGHSDLGSSGGEIHLVSRTTGLTEKLSGDDLAGLLVNNGILMGVFNSCRGACGPTSDLGEPTRDNLVHRLGERNLAEALVKRGIPVLAMVERIPDRVALTFSQLLYRNLKQGYPVDLSLNRVRQGLISAYGSHQLYWALPILYLQPDFDGCLIAKKEDKVHDWFAATNVYPAILEEEEENSDTNGQKALSNSAIAEDRKEIVINPQNFEVYNYLGLEFYNSGHLEEAIAAYQLAVQANPDFVNAYNNLGVASYDLGRIPEAIAAYEKVLEINPHHESARNNLELALQYQPESSTDSEATLDAHPVESTNSAPPVVTDKDKSHQIDRNQRRVLPISWLKRWLWLGIGVTCLGFLLFGFYRWQSRPSLVTLPPRVEVPAPNVNPDSLENLTAKATQLFEQGDIAGGQKIVGQLLDEGLLNFARTALEAVPNDQLDRPEISFIRGRLAWQEVQQGNPNYSLNDARRYWEWATANQGNNPIYYNALGFAYYAEGNLERANASWLKALELLSASSNPQQLTQEVCSTSADTLTACAGLALVITKYAQNQAPTQQARSLAWAVSLHQMVMQGDPVNFQPQALGMNNWLWTEAAIEEWRSLFNLSVTKSPQQSQWANT